MCDRVNRINMINRRNIIILCYFLLLLNCSTAIGAGVKLEFKEAHLNSLIMSVSYNTGKVFLVDSNVNERITMRMSRPVNECELFSAFKLILISYGYKLETSSIQNVFTPNTKSFNLKKGPNIYQVSRATEKLKEKQNIENPNDHVKIYLNRDQKESIIKVPAVDSSECVIDNKAKERTNKKSTKTKLEEYRKSLLNNPEQLLDALEITPYKVDDKLVGYMIKMGTDKDLLNRTGFQEGDVLLSINGKSLVKNAKETLNLIKKLGNATDPLQSVKYEILRNGNKKTVVFPN